MNDWRWSLFHLLIMRCPLSFSSYHDFTLWPALFIWKTWGRQMWRLQLQKLKSLRYSPRLCTATSRFLLLVIAKSPKLIVSEDKHPVAQVRWYSSWSPCHRPCRRQQPNYPSGEAENWIESKFSKAENARQQITRLWSKMSYFKMAYFNIWYSPDGCKRVNNYKYFNVSRMCFILHGYFGSGPHAKELTLAKWHLTLKLNLVRMTCNMLNQL